ncbi:MAG: hypothetical protein LRY76_03390 [Alphaproteobacteria bacterium]|nr:hypothetical protein [Alphaproteobacteria bacterium]
MISKTKKAPIPLPDIDRRARLISSYSGNTLFSDKAGRPDFDDYQYEYYENSKSNPAILTARDSAIWGRFWLDTFQAGRRPFYKDQSISGGVMAHNLAVDVDHRHPVKIGKHKIALRTVYQLDRGAGVGERFERDVLSPNIEYSHAMRQNLINAFSDTGLVIPLDKEGMMRISRADPRASFGRAAQEEDHMEGVWIPTIDSCGGMIIAGDTAFSRNSDYREDMRGLFISLGNLNSKVRENSDFWFARMDRSLATSSERLEDGLAYLIYCLENEFYAPEAARALAWKIEIHKRLSDPAYNAASSQPIDMSKISTQLRMEYTSNEPWAVENRSRMDAWSVIGEQLLQGYFVSHIAENHMGPLPKSYHEARKRIGAGRAFDVPTRVEDLGMDSANPLIEALIERARDPENFILLEGQKRVFPQLETPKLNAIPEYRAAYNIKTKKEFSLNATTPMPEQIMDRESIFTDPKYKPQVFAESLDHFSRLSPVEKIAQQQALGAGLTMTPPADHPGWIAVFQDFEKGDKARSHPFMKKAPLPLEELGSALKASYPKQPDKFEQEVIVPEMESFQKFLDTYKAAYEKRYGEKPLIIDSFDILGGQRAYNQLKHLTAISDGRAQSSDMRADLRQKILQFCALKMPLTKGWQYSSERAEEVVFATLIQMGLVDRGRMDRHNLLVTDEKDNPLGLYDRVKPLADVLRDAAKTGVPAGRHAVALAQLFTLHEQMTETAWHKHNGPNLGINPGRIDKSLMNYRSSPDRQKMEALYAEIKPLILSVFVDMFTKADLEGLPQEYRDAWNVEKGLLDYKTGKEASPFILIQAGGRPEP